MNYRVSRAGIRIAGAVVMMLASLTHAQDYPGKPVRLVVGFATGGNVDLVARMVAQKMSDGLGRGMVVENRTGAGSMIANEYVAKAAADGYTLLMVSGAHITLAATKAKLPYDPVRDFSWVSTVVSYPIVISVRPDSQFKSFDELLAYAKANPGKLNYPTPGIGAFYHLSAELLSSMTGVELTHVPFRGGSEPLTEIISGRGDILFDALTNTYPHIKAGKFRPLAVSALKPSAVLPDTPTIASSVPGYEAFSFLGIAAPAGTPTPVIERLNREVRKALSSDLGQRFAESGGEPRPSTPDEMGKLVETEIAKWKRVVETRKIQAN
jgi:tripartite-type tricarboxylate transporter receptor subunit TctC